MHSNPFSDAELDRRLTAVRRDLAGRGLDGAVLSQPESVFYLTGLDHWGYFAPHLLLVPLDRRPLLVTRAMERISIDNMVNAADFRGHSDSETAAAVAAPALRDLGLAGKRLGLESWSSGLSHGLAQELIAATAACWVDISGLVDRLRWVKSAEELVLVRRAAEVTDAATAAAVAAVGEGVAEAEVAAECLAAMTRSGGEPPGFGPFIRPTARLGEEHTTWGRGRYAAGDSVFLEIAGCVARYNCPNGRLVPVGRASQADRAVALVAEEAFGAACEALRPGVLARQVYAAWQDVVDAAGLGHYRRHHCGYQVGIAFPPTWTGGPSVAGLRHDSDLMLQAGMTFHLMSWLMGCGRGDFFYSNTVLLDEEGAEVLTTTPHRLFD